MTLLMPSSPYRCAATDRTTDSGAAPPKEEGGPGKEGKQ